MDRMRKGSSANKCSIYLREPLGDKVSSALSLSLSLLSIPFCSDLLHVILPSLTSSVLFFFFVSFCFKCSRSVCVCLTQSISVILHSSLSLSLFLLSLILGD